MPTEPNALNLFPAATLYAERGNRVGVVRDGRARPPRRPPVPVPNAFAGRSERLEVRFIATSGDHPDTGTLATFNPLFPTAIYFGQGVVNLNGPSNWIGLRPAAKLQLAKNVRLAVDYDFSWRESLQDGVYGLGVNLLRSGLDNQARHIGSQPSLGFYWQLNRHFSLSAAYTHFSVGPFLTESATPGRNVNYAAIWATYEF